MKKRLFVLLAMLSMTTLAATHNITLTNNTPYIATYDYTDYDPTVAKSSGTLQPHAKTTFIASDKNGYLYTLLNHLKEDKIYFMGWGSFVRYYNRTISIEENMHYTIY